MFPSQNYPLYNRTNHRLTYYSSSSVKGHKLACHLLVPYALRITTTEAVQELTDSAMYDPEKPQHTVFSSQSSRYFELHKTCQVCVSFTVHALLLSTADKKIVNEWALWGCAWFGAFMAMTMNITVFRNVTPCSLVKNLPKFEGTCCSHLQSNKLLQKSVNSWPRCHITNNGIRV